MAPGAVLCYFQESVTTEIEKPTKKEALLSIKQLVSEFMGVCASVPTFISDCCQSNSDALKNNVQKTDSNGGPELTHRSQTVIERSNCISNSSSPAVRWL